MTIGEQLRQARLSRDITASQVAAETKMKVQTVEAIERNNFDRIPAPIYCKGFIRLYAEYVGLDPQPLIDEYVAAYAPPLQIQTELSVTAETPEPEPESKPEPKHGKRQRFSFLRHDGSEQDEKLKAVPEQAKEADVSKHESEQEREMDLFEHIGHYRKPADEIRQALDFPEIRETVVRFSLEVWQKIRQWFKLFGEKIKPGNIKLPAIRFQEAPVKSVSVIVGILFILILLASAVSRCTIRPDVAGMSTSPPPEKLRLAFDPPDPYID